MDDINEFYLARIAVETPNEADLSEFILALWDSHRKSVFTFVYRRSGDRELASDVCQQAFLRAMEACRKGIARRRTELNFAAWLQRIAHNLMTDHFRKWGRIDYFGEVREPDGQVESATGWLAGGVVPPIPAQLSQSQELRILHECISSLPDLERNLIVLCDLKDIPQKDVAEQLGLSRPTVSRTRTKAHGLLRTCYANRALGANGESDA